MLLLWGGFWIGVDVESVPSCLPVRRVEYDMAQLVRRGLRGDLEVATERVEDGGGGDYHEEDKGQSDHTL